MQFWELYFLFQIYSAVLGIGVRIVVWLWHQNLASTLHETSVSEDQLIILLDLFFFKIFMKKMSSAQGFVLIPLQEGQKAEIWNEV